MPHFKFIINKSSKQLYVAIIYDFTTSIVVTHLYCYNLSPGTFLKEHPTLRIISFIKYYKLHLLIQIILLLKFDEI